MTFSENVARLQPSATMAVSSLAKRLRAEGRDIIDLSAGEPDFDTPSWLVDAAVEGVRAGATRYTPPPPECRTCALPSPIRSSPAAPMRHGTTSWSPQEPSRRSSTPASPSSARATR